VRYERDTAARNVRPVMAATGSGRRVAVTGAAGFIGSAVCRRLAADGDEPIGIDLAGADRIADVSDAAATVAALGGADAVIHTAAIVSERGRMADFVRVNVRGTRNVLDAAAGRPAVVIASVAGGATSSPATSTRTRCRARAVSPTSTPRARPRSSPCAAGRP
jgi:nucleoside-diphosphate-sugar epimerase